VSSITIDTGRKNYEVRICEGLLREVGTISTQTIAARKAAVITDDNVDRLYGDTLVASLERAGYKISKYVVPNGEESKNIENYVSLLDFLAKDSFSRSDCVFALGGGMIGDLAGFAAATYMRGLKLVQLPTTLLAAVDSSVGGKNGVNLGMGKNLVGTFYQPDLVLCDTELFSTLPEENFRDGCAEIIKYAVISDVHLFEMLKSPIANNIGKIIKSCLAIKGQLVFEDEFDYGSRRLLNLGHTFGHAIEKISDYKISHGNAVATGIVLAAGAGVKMGVCSMESLKNIKELVKSYGLPTETEVSSIQLADAMQMDKKRIGKEVTFVIPERIGSCILTTVPLSELSPFVEGAIKTLEGA